jgi:hypothetical protein
LYSSLVHGIIFISFQVILKISSAKSNQVIFLDEKFEKCSICHLYFGVLFIIFEIASDKSRVLVGIQN